MTSLACLFEFMEQKDLMQDTMIVFTFGSWRVFWRSLDGGQGFLP